MLFFDTLNLQVTSDTCLFQVGNSPFLLDIDRDSSGHCWDFFFFFFFDGFVLNSLQSR
jgi:hypothetical protein